MALVGANGWRIGLGAARAYGGSTVLGPYRREGKELTGAKRNSLLSFISTASVPDGHRYPATWLAARAAGGLSAYLDRYPTTFTPGPSALTDGRALSGTAGATITGAADLTLALFASGVAPIVFDGGATIAGALSAEGLAQISVTGSATLGGLVLSEGTASFTFDVSGEAQLVVPVAGSTSITVSLPVATLDLAAPGSGLITVTFTLEGNAAGIAHALGTVPVQFSGAATARADGSLNGAITPFTELSPQTLAAAVWNAVASDSNLTGTMGRLLNSSGGGSDPDTIAAAVWAAVARTLTGQVAANVTAVNGVTVDGAGTAGDPWGPA